MNLLSGVLSHHTLLQGYPETAASISQQFYDYISAWTEEFYPTMVKKKKRSFLYPGENLIEAEIIECKALFID